MLASAVRVCTGVTRSDHLIRCVLIDLVVKDSIWHVDHPWQSRTLHAVVMHTFAHRQHAFWDCLVTAQVRRQLALALPIGFQLSQHHLWLVEAPPGIMQVVWDEVAMATVHAMVARRKHMWSRSFPGAEDPKVCVQARCARAKSAIWLSLHIFSLVHRHLPCKGWDVVGASHPFLFVSGQPSRLFVRLPSTDNASSSCT
jgi:hypothetical protein